MPLSTFPEEGSIPPASFYNFGGFATFLNQNPSYKLIFASLYTGPIITSTISSLGFDITKVPLCPDVTIMSFNQMQEYSNQLGLFRKIYTYNSNAYVDSQISGISPVYYNFTNYNELMKYKASVGLVNKLYNFKIMSEYWSFPFPIAM